MTIQYIITFNYFNLTLSSEFLQIERILLQLLIDDKQLKIFSLPQWFLGGICSLLREITS